MSPARPWRTHVARRTGATEATEAMETTAADLGSDVPGADDAYAVALDRWLASGAADLDERIAPVLADLGLDVGPDALMTSLSGGQAARVALAALLLSRFDVVLLDEPTNDLDLDGLERLEAFVQGLRGGVVLVSHDREFLARCVTRIVELDLAQGQVAVYDGGYDSFLEERATARRHAREAYEHYAETRSDLVQRARTQREWSSQGVRNAMRKSPDNDKILGARRPPSPRRSRHRRCARWSSAHRVPRGGRGATQGVGAAVRHRRRTTVERGGRHPQRGHPAAR